MPRPRKNASQSTGSQGSTGSTGASNTSAGSENKVSHGQASYVLDRLIAERRITRTDINRYVAEMGHEISELERRLQHLREAHGGTIAAVAATVAAGAAAMTVVRRRGPGRPAGSTNATTAKRGPGRPAGSGRGPGRPAGSGRGPGRPAGSGAASTAAAAPAAQTSGSTEAQGSTGSKGGAKRGRKASAAITAGQLASRQLQGRYLALVRQFAENKRAQYARIAKERGREAAIKEMQDALKK